jgi:hypothetical protein
VSSLLGSATAERGLLDLTCKVLYVARHIHGI